MASTTQNPIQRGMSLIQEGVALLGGVFNFSTMQAPQQYSAAPVRTRRTTKSRRRTSGNQTAQSQPQAVGQGQTQQAKPHRRVSASTRRKLQAAAKARWAKKHAQPQAA